MKVIVEGLFIKNDVKKFEDKVTHYALILVDDEVVKVKNCRYGDDVKPLSKVTVKCDLSVYDNKMYARIVD